LKSRLTTKKVKVGPRAPYGAKMLLGLVISTNLRIWRRIKCENWKMYDTV